MKRWNILQKMLALALLLLMLDTGSAWARAETPAFYRTLAVIARAEASFQYGAARARQQLSYMRRKPCERRRVENAVSTTIGAEAAADGWHVV